MIPILMIALGGYLLLESTRYAKGGRTTGLTLGVVCEISTDFPDADFWVQRRGSEHTIGTPKKIYAREDIGIRVREEYRDRVDPRYIYYAVQNLHSLGFFSDKAVGSLALKNLRTNDVREIPVSMRRGGRVYNDKELLSKYKAGESIGFSATAHLKAKGLIPRSSGERVVSEKYKAKKRMALRK